MVGAHLSAAGRVGVRQRIVYFATSFVISISYMESSKYSHRLHLDGHNVAESKSQSQ